MSFSEHMFKYAQRIISLNFCNFVMNHGFKSGIRDFWSRASDAVVLGCPYSRKSVFLELWRSHQHKFVSRLQSIQKTMFMSCCLKCGIPHFLTSKRAFHWFLLNYTDFIRVRNLVEYCANPFQFLYNKLK